MITTPLGSWARACFNDPGPKPTVCVSFGPGSWHGTDRAKALTPRQGPLLGCLGQGQAEVAGRVGPEPQRAQPGRGELGLDPGAAELGRDLGAPLFPGRERTLQVEIVGRDMLRARRAPPHLDPLVGR